MSSAQMAGNNDDLSISARNSFVISAPESSTPAIHVASVAIRDPSNIIKVGSTYYVYFTYIPAANPGYPNGYSGTVYYASSTDLKTWTVGTEVIGKGSAGAFDEGGSYSPCIYAEGGMYYLIYSGVDSTYPGSIVQSNGMASASSPTGPFTKLGVILPLGTSDDWDSISANDVNLIKIGTEYRIYYSGAHVAGHKQMGFARSNVVTGPYVKYAGNPVISSITGYDSLECNSVFLNDGMLNITADTVGPTGTLQHWQSPENDGITWELLSPLNSLPAHINATATILAPGYYSDENGMVKCILYHDKTSTDMGLIAAPIIQLSDVVQMMKYGLLSIIQRLRLSGISMSATVGIDVNSATLTDRPIINLQKSSSVERGVFAVTGDGESLGDIVAKGVDSSATSEASAAITFEQEGAASAFRCPSRILFKTSDSTTSRVERMRIDHLGRVGIGATPTAVIHLKAGSATAGTAPLKLTTGVLLTNPEAGAIEYLSGVVYIRSDNLSFPAIVPPAAGFKLGLATTDLLGFYGVAAVDQPATVADPAGGATVDAECRTQLAALIDRLQELGLIA